MAAASGGRKNGLLVVVVAAFHAVPFHFSVFVFRWALNPPARADVGARRAETGEARALLDLEQSPPIGHVADVGPALRRAEMGGVLDLAQVVDVRAVAEIPEVHELNIGHAYYGGGDTESAPSVGVGMLGVDWSFENGAYRIKRIHGGADWDVDARGPLSLPGLDVKEGDYLLAVNGIELEYPTNPYSLLETLANKQTVIKVSADAKGEEAKEFTEAHGLKKCLRVSLAFQSDRTSIGSGSKTSWRMLLQSGDAFESAVGPKGRFI